MTAILKLLLFGLVLLLIVVGGVYSYRSLNKRILASDKLSAVVVYALLLILANVMLLFGGVWVLLKVYGFLRID